MAFYTEDELKDLNIASFGYNVKISKLCQIYRPEDTIIGNNIRIDDFCILSGKIRLGNNIHLAPYTHLAGGDVGIEMHDFSGAAFNVIITSSSDDYSGRSMTNPTIPDTYKKYKKSAKIIIKKHSIIGSGSIIMPGVTLEEGTSIGALTFVNKNTESWSIYSGNPAKKIMNRKKDLLLLEKDFLEKNK